MDWPKSGMLYRYSSLRTGGGGYWRDGLLHGLAKVKSVIDKLVKGLGGVWKNGLLHELAKVRSVIH